MKAQDLEFRSFRKKKERKDDLDSCTSLKKHIIKYK